MMPRPRSLTPDEIAAAALTVIDRDGLSGLSMRTTAEELGRGTMSLYRYIEDREELERLVVDHVLAAVEIALPQKTSWQEHLRTLATRIRAAVSAHPAIVPLLLRHRHSSQGVRRCAEGLLSALTDGGFAGEQRVIALRTLVSYLSGSLQAQDLGPLAGAGTRVLARLPATEYPLLSATAKSAKNVGADDEFLGGLTVVMDGLARLRRARVRAAKRSAPG